MEKICNKCKIKKVLNDFHLDKNVKDGHRGYCKKCINEKYSRRPKMQKICLVCKNFFTTYSGKKKYCSKECYIKNYKESHKKYLELNKERIKISKHKWYLKNRKKEIKRVIEYNREHKEELKEYKKQYQKQYIKLHKIELLEYHKKYGKNRRKIDINFKIACNLRRRINHILKDNFKSESTLKLLGCSIEKFKRHLVKKFTKDMSFSNYGKWHIDHIKPCASFDLSKPSEQCKCFNYKNLQPLWAQDNLSKGDKYD